MNDQTTAFGEIMKGLLAERGILHYALLLLQQEGRQLPGEVESTSGFVLSRSGDLYGFWLDWDDEAGSYILDPWYLVEDHADLDEEMEYHRARHSLGI